MTQDLILLTLFLTFTFHRLGTDLLVILLKGSKVLTTLGELTLLHTLTDVPVDEGTLRVHKVELVVDASEDLGDGGRVGDHADGALDLGEVTTRDDGRRLVVDTALEAGGAPVDELDGALRLDGGDGGVDVLGDDVTAEHEAAGHVLAVARVALGEHAGRLEGGVGDLGNGELLVVRLLGGDDGRERREDEVDTRVRHEVGLELGDVDVEGTVEAEGRGEGRDDLADEAVQVGVGGALNVQVAAAEVVDGLVVEHGGDIGVLEERVRREDGVVRLNDGGRDLRRRVDGVAELGLLAVVDGEALEEEGTKAGASATTDGVEDHEALKAGAVISELPNSV